MLLWLNSHCGFWFQLLCKTVYIVYAIALTYQSCDVVFICRMTSKGNLTANVSYEGALPVSFFEMKVKDEGIA